MKNKREKNNKIYIFKANSTKEMKRWHNIIERTICLSYTNMVQVKIETQNRTKVITFFQNDNQNQSILDNCIRSKFQVFLNLQNSISVSIIDNTP